MKNIDLKFQLTTMPPIFLRGEHVQAVIKNNQNKFVLGAKNMYPDNISRFVGGGLDEANPTLGITREIDEELGVMVPPEQIIPLAKINCQIQHQQDIVFVVHLFFTKINGKLSASSDLDDLAFLSEKELQDLIKNYQNLTNKTLPKFDWSWADYGKVFAEIHQIGLELTKDLGL